MFREAVRQVAQARVPPHAVADSSLSKTTLLIILDDLQSTIESILSRAAFFCQKFFFQNALLTKFVLIFFLNGAKIALPKI